MSLPRVYAAINAITAAFASHGIARERLNLDDGYTYRGVDEVTERLAPLLAEHKLCILPRVLERTQGERIDPAGESLIHVSLRVAFDLVSVEDGSSHTIEAVGEALDHSDKASAKAMTSAYKHAVLHAFCIPVSGHEDADRSSPGRNSTAALPAPVEGWAQWAEDIASVVSSCATPEAIERLLASNRGQLSGLAREQPDEYARIGRAIAVRRKELAQPVGVTQSVGAAAAGMAGAGVGSVPAAKLGAGKPKAGTPRVGAARGTALPKAVPVEKARAVKPAPSGKERSIVPSEAGPGEARSPGKPAPATRSAPASTPARALVAVPPAGNAGVLEHG